MTKKKNDPTAELAAINGDLNRIRTIAEMQKSSVTLLLEAYTALKRADAIESMLNKAAQMGFTVDMADGIFKGAFDGATTADLVKVAATWNVVGNRALASSRRIGDEIDEMLGEK